jgi:Flp pilus assembly protein TadD
MFSYKEKSYILQSIKAFSLVVCLAGCASHPHGTDSGLTSSVGDQLRSKGDDVGAANFYQHALQADPTDTHARLALAEILEAHGDTVNAATQYSVLSQQDLDDGAYHRDLGRVLIKQGKASDAKGEYEKALAIDSDDVKAMNGLGIALDYLGNHDAAQKTYKQALDEKDDDLVTLNNLAHSYVLSGSYNEAIALLEPHLKDKGVTPALRQNLAEAYGMAGMDVDAERVGRMDLSPDQVKHNIAYYHTRREQLSVAPKFFADLGSFPTEAMAEGRVEDVKSGFVKETAGLVINVTPEVKAIGGTPTFSVRALGFTNAEKVRVFCDKLKKQNIACTAHG